MAKKVAKRKPKAKQPEPTLELKPGACPTCGSSDFWHQLLLARQVVPMGMMVEWHKCDCRNCGQRFTAQHRAAID